MFLSYKIYQNVEMITVHILKTKLKALQNASRGHNRERKLTREPEVYFTYFYLNICVCNYFNQCYKSEKVVNKSDCNFACQYPDSTNTYSPFARH